MFKDPPSPEGLIAIPGASSTPVLDWYCMDFFQGQTIEMILMIMGDDDQVNMGKSLD